MSRYIGNAPNIGVFETQSFMADGVTNTYNLLYQVGSAASIRVCLDGVVQEPIYSYQLAQGGKQIVFTFVPNDTERVSIVYLGREFAVPVPSFNYPIRHREVGTGTRTDFDLTIPLDGRGFVIEDGLMIFVDKVQQTFGDDWSLNIPPGETGSVVSFNVPPANGAIIDFYIHSLERTDLVTVPDKTITGNKFVNNLTIGGPNNYINAIYTNQLYTNLSVAEFNVDVLKVRSHSGFFGSEFTLETNAVLTDTVETLFEFDVHDNAVCWFTVKIACINVVPPPGAHTSATSKSYFAFLKGGVRKNESETAEIFDFTLDHTGGENNSEQDYDIQVVVVAPNKLRINVLSDGSRTHWAGTLERQCISFSNLLIVPGIINEGEVFGNVITGLAQQFIQPNSIQIGETIPDTHTVGNMILSDAGAIISEGVLGIPGINYEIAVSNGIESQEQFANAHTIIT